MYYVGVHTDTVHQRTCVQVASHLKSIRLVSVSSSLPCINIGVRIELTLKIFLNTFFMLKILPLFNQ